MSSLSIVVSISLVLPLKIFLVVFATSTAICFPASFASLSVLKLISFPAILSLPISTTNLLNFLALSGISSPVILEANFIATNKPTVLTPNNFICFSVSPNDLANSVATKPVALNALTVP